MADIIQLLPDSVANQIAAGEVVQRPASVVKELVENSIDSGATQVKIIIVDAGKTLVQIIDNGCGMSDTDARMAFERHATSKIRNINDLFAIHTNGFRGEALASIAAVATVNLKTKRTEDTLGTEIEISGSEIILHEPSACASGSNFAVKNLFYNVPARRKFLKSNIIEFKHIVNEVHRISLANPNVGIILTHNNGEVYNLPATNIKQRIINLFGRNLNQNLVGIESETSLIKIYGFIGKPEHAKKSTGEQFFFVNNRYMRNPYLHKAVQNGYEGIITPDSNPSYFIYFDVNPASIDINIHPTKTEIKFEDERFIWQILNATIKQTLGKSNFMPSIDFNTEGLIDIPVFTPNRNIEIPKINLNSGYNPFHPSPSTPNTAEKRWEAPKTNPNTQHWEKLYSGFDNNNDHITFQSDCASPTNNLLPEGSVVENNNFFLQLKSKYIATPVKSGMMLIHQQRAHERILYEQFLRKIKNHSALSQQTMFPEVIELSTSDYALAMSLMDELLHLGIDARDFGSSSIVINSVPADIKNPDIKSIIHNILEEFKSTEQSIKTNAGERLANSLAQSSAIKIGTLLVQQEMRELMDNLFACENPGFSPSGLSTVTILSIEEINKRF